MVSLKGILPTKNDFALAAGAAMSSTVVGYIQGVLPVNLEFIPGMTEFLVGVGLKKFLLKKGMMGEFAKGIAIAGLSHMIASFVPQITGTFAQVKPVGMTMQTQVNGLVPYPHAISGVEGSYVHRNPVMGATHTETKIAPKGTSHLLAPGQRIPGTW